MKKNFMYFAALLCCLFTFSACGGDDEPQEQTSATAVYNMTFSQDLLDAANVFVTYKGDNGRNIMESVTTTAWTKTITTTSFPAQFGVRYVFSTKNSSELTKENYDLKCVASISVVMSHGASFNNSKTLVSMTNVAKNKVATVLDDISGKSFGYKVSKDGHPTQANDLKYD